MKTCRWQLLSRQPKLGASDFTCPVLPCSTFRSIKGQGRSWLRWDLNVKGSSAFNLRLHPRAEPKVMVHQPKPPSRDLPAPSRPSALSANPLASLPPGKDSDG